MTLNPVTVTDPMANLSAISCPDTQLAAGDNETCSATYTTTSTDVTNGSIVNTGTATGTPPTGPTVTDQSQVTVPYAAASITIAKSASIASYSASNVPVTYHYLVTNTGNVTLNPVTVTDPMANLSAISCPDTQLAAGDNETCSATYTTTSTDVTNGSIVNTGTATGTPPTGPTVTDQSQVTVPYASARRSRIAKSASIASYSASARPGHLPLPRHQHRQRDAEPGHGHRPDGEPLGDQLPGHPRWPPGDNETCTRHLHDHVRPT